MSRSSKTSTEGWLLLMTIIIVLVLGASVSFQTGCTKTDAVRIAEIDAQLRSMGPTGSTEDADKRSGLRSEPAALVRGQTSQVQTVQYSEPTVPAARATANTIVIAGDSSLQGGTPMRSTWSNTANTNGGGLYATPSLRGSSSVRSTSTSVSVGHSSPHP
jgi:hypothetical protein